MDDKRKQLLIDEVDQGFRAHNFEKAYAAAKELSDHGVYDGIYSCARIFERGWLDGKPDLEQAYYYYEQILSRWQLVHGGLGCVRVMLAQKKHEAADRAIELCLGSRVGSFKRLAYLTLGRVYEGLSDPPDYKNARKAYLKASWYGSACANRLYVRSLWRSGHKTGALLAYIPATLLHPVYRLIYGKSTYYLD